MRSGIFRRSYTLFCSTVASSGATSNIPGAGESAGQLKHTALYDFHKEMGAKMMPFAGWDMPIQYKEGMSKEHLHCRSSAALFDVSHMCRVDFGGADHERFLEWVTPGDVGILKPGRGRLAILMLEHGGIKDDCMIFRGHDGINCNVVLNAGCAESDLAHLRERREQFTGDVKLNVRDDLSLFALQGPKAATVMSKYIPNLETMIFMTNILTKIDGVDVAITRCGYTGEDGFEIHVSGKDEAIKVARALTAHEEVKMAGLGARDTLRLEAGLCLYGHELNPEVDPIAADLMWTITKRRREQANFIGAEHVLNKLKDKENLVPRIRIGIVSPKGPVAREGAHVVAPGTETEIGTITSGCPSPSLGKNVAQCYLDRAFAKAGTPVELVLKNRRVAGEVHGLPFVPSHYYRGPPKKPGETPKK